MEWVEVTGKTVEEAIALALEQLGVSEDDAEVEVMEEAKAGLFGRVRGEARVRARVRPTSPRPKNDERTARPRGRAARPAAAESSERETRAPRPRTARPAPSEAS